MATREDLEKQLASIKSGLLDFSSVGEESFFRTTGQTKLETKEVPRYTDVYNKEFGAIKDIRFSLGEDVSTASTIDRALYVFDPTKIAKEKTEKTIKTVEDANLEVIKQQDSIKAFLTQERELAKSSVLQTYLDTFFKKASKGEIKSWEWDSVDLNTPEGLARWRTATKRKTQNPKYGGVRTGPVYYVKLTPEESLEKKRITESIERTRFMASPDLQK